VDETFALVEYGRWYLYGHLSDNAAIAKVLCLLNETNANSEATIGAVRRVWGEKIPDDDNIADIDDVPGATFTIWTEDSPIDGFFPVTVVHNLEWLATVNRLRQEAGYGGNDV